MGKRLFLLYIFASIHPYIQYIHVYFIKLCGTFNWSSYIGVYKK